MFAMSLNGLSFLVAACKNTVEYCRFLLHVCKRVDMVIIRVQTLMREGAITLYCECDASS